MLEQIAKQLRALQIYAHHAHNNCVGSTFMQDHEMFGAIYPEAEADYDSVVERIIGTANGKPLDTLTLTSEAAASTVKLGRDPGDCNCNFFSSILKMELGLCMLVDKCVASGEYPEGTVQLIGNIADKSMSRQYKLRQRMK